jgi:hypothetical protein
VLHLVRRRTRWLAAVGAIAAVMAAFLAWGPIGLGNGPLWLPASSGGYGWTEPRTEPVTYVLPIGNHGHSAAVIDSVAVTGSPRFALPALQAALIGHMARYACTALGPFSGRESVLPGCVRPHQHGAAGAVVAAGTYLAVGRERQPALVLVLAGPRPRQCWEITAVVVRYHAGIRHWVATFPQGSVITCGVGGKVPSAS